MDKKPERKRKKCREKHESGEIITLHEYLLQTTPHFYSFHTQDSTTNFGFHKYYFRFA